MFGQVLGALVALFAWAHQEPLMGPVRLPRPTYNPSALPASAVPTGTPEVGDYSGSLRPQAHFSAPSNFLNDPDGMFRDDKGIWHLYYEHNPIGPWFGNSTWAHATSTDLHTWINQPIAMFPPNTTSEIFTGSAVIDQDNTSGFFPEQDNGIVAVYTLATETRQVIQVAYSKDGGFTFEQYEANPVIDVGSNQFRDPKVIWYEDHWVMAVAFATDMTVGLYVSKNLRDWALASNVTNTDLGIVGYQYECPNLIQIPMLNEDGSVGDPVWVMDVSVNPGAPQGGSITQFFPGDFNGTHFSPYGGSPIIGDFGKDNYAGQFFYIPKSDPDFAGEAISIAWASNWQYTNAIPTAYEGWRGAMYLPRQNYLVKGERLGTWDLISFPYGLDTILAKRLKRSTNVATRPFEVDFAKSSSNAVYFDINITLPEGVPVSPKSHLGFSLSSPLTKEQITGGTYFGFMNHGQFYLTRDQTHGFTSHDLPFFSGQFSVASINNLKRITGVFDRSIIEVFLDGGRKSGTMVFFPTSPLTRFSLQTESLPQGSQVTVELREVKAIWKALEGQDGLVRGNVSAA